MGNLIFSAIDNFKQEVRSAFKDKTVILLLQFAFYAIGIILGFVIKPGELIRSEFECNVHNYYCMVLNRDSSVFDLFFNRLISNLGYLILFYIIGCTLLTYSASFVIISYRGFILSFSINVFASTFGVTGVLLGGFLILPQNVITTVVLIVFSATLFTKCKNRKLKDYFRSNAINAFIFYLITFIGVIIELLLICLLFRPLNFYF